jgi:hypothetical protein
VEDEGRVTDDAVILESQLQTTVANGFAVGFLIATMSVTAPLPSYAQRLNWSCSSVPAEAASVVPTRITRRWLIYALRSFHTRGSMLEEKIRGDFASFASRACVRRRRLQWGRGNRRLGGPSEAGALASAGIVALLHTPLCFNEQYSSVRT